jgi:hypothetical protein
MLVLLGGGVDVGKKENNSIKLEFSDDSATKSKEPDGTKVVNLKGVIVASTSRGDVLP